MAYIIETFNLTKKFVHVKGFTELLLHPFRKREVIAFKDVSIKVKEGEIFGILGPNGAGKTTLIKVLCTLILPTSGKAFVDGHDIVKEEKEVKASIGLITGEERSFYWRLTGRQNLKFFAYLYNLSPSEAQKRIDEVLEFVGLKEKADDKFYSYSAGMKQRLAIARGLLNDPKILFMDEPTKNLDPIAAQNLRDFIKKIVKEQGKTVFLSTHNLTEAEQLCDRIAFINKQIKAYGTISELKKMIEDAGRGEIYVIEVKGIDRKTISRLKNLDNIVDFSYYFQSDSALIEIHLIDREILPYIIEVIVKAGGKVYSCKRKEIVIDEIFKIIEEDGRNGRNKNGSKREEG